MGTKSKIVRFDHFCPYCLEKDENGIEREIKLDLNALFQRIANIISEQGFHATQKEIQGDPHMIYICQYHTSCEIWELQILHLREQILPGKIDNKGEYIQITLDENEYLAESTTILYSKAKKILYMQRNLYGTSIKVFEEYLQESTLQNTPVLLKPILHRDLINKIKPDKRYRKFIMVADSGQLNDTQNAQTLGNLLSTFGQFKGPIVKVELGFGRQRAGLLDSKKIAQLTHEAYHFGGTQNLKILMADDNDTNFELIDLMADRASYKIKVNYTRHDPITHELLFEECLKECMNDKES